MVALALAVTVSTLLPRAAGAQPGDLGAIVLDAVVGEVQVVVRMQPERPVAGVGHFDITITQQATGLPVADAEVRLFARLRPGGERQVVRALSEPETPGIYVANIEFDRAGTWDMEVEAATGGETLKAPFALDVASRTRTPGNSAVATAMWALVTIALFGGSFVLVYFSRRAKRSRPSAG